MRSAEPDTTPWRSMATTLRVLVIGAAVAILGWLLSDVLLLIFFAALLALLLHGLSRHVAVWTGLPYRPALALVVAVLVLLGCVVAVWGGPRVARQAEQLSGSLSDQARVLRQTYGQTRIGHWALDHLPVVGPSEGPMLMVAGSTLDLVASLLVLVITALYFAAAPALYVDGMVRLVPLASRARSREILGHVGETLWLWLIGQAIDMLVVGVLAGVGLAIVGVPLPILLGLITGLLTFIPYFGAIAAAVPAVLMGLTVSGTTALWALGVYTLCHITEGYVVAPLVQKRMIDLPPAVTILSLAVFGTLFGPLGAVLGTPLAATALVMVREGYVADVLGDPEMR